jgi:hypothetical protein
MVQAPPLERYYETFGMAPEAMLDPYYSVQPDEWHPLKHFEIDRGANREKQHVALFSGYDHSYDPNDRLLNDTLDAVRYITKHFGTANLAANLEGRSRHPSLHLGDRAIFGAFGELGLMEAHLLLAGVPKQNLKWPEPPREVINEVAQSFDSPIPTLWYLMLRKVPQLIDYRVSPSYPYTWLFLCYEEYKSQVDLSGIPEQAYYPSTLMDLWNEQHTPDQQMAPGQEASPELVAVLRAETTLLPCLLVPEDERNDVQKVAVAFNMQRQEGWAASLDYDLEANKNTLLASGRMHTMVIEKWLHKRFAGQVQLVTEAEAPFTSGGLSTYNQYNG